LGIIPDSHRTMRLPVALEKPDPSAYTNCIRCGLCLAVCPTYREALVETASPRGRAQLARKNLDGELPLSENLVEQMYSCFACMACNEICPVGIHPADLALSMRFVQEQLEPAGWKKTLFEGLIPHPGRMEAAFVPLRLYQGLGLRRLASSLGILRLIPHQLKDLEGQLPAIPNRPLRGKLPEITPAKGEESQRVGFFLGCAQTLLFAEESAATVRVLARNGCKVYSPRDVVCCGMPARGYGRMDLVREQAKVNIALFEQLPVDTIVTDCATCGSTLKEYGEFLKDDPAWAARADAFCRKVRDVSEFLAAIPLEKPQGRISAKVTYHDPCHLRRAQGVWKQPRQILGLIDGIEFVELPEADWCCGSAGSQLITHYETSLKVLNRKMDALAETGAQVIASGCPGCQMQLTTGIKLRDLHVKVVHPIALLDQAYGDA
jgi:glycolate oxidase iron-sulfur subunit